MKPLDAEVEQEPSEEDEVLEWLKDQEKKDLDPSSNLPPPVPDPDFWRIAGDSLHRYHQTPTTKLFVPEEGD